jgi:hypothetical protein
MFMYDPIVGSFVRLETRGGNGRAGSVAGARHPHGYTQIKIAGRQYLAHRLAWLYITGEWPSNHVDHINGDKTDNRFENLRDVSRNVNMQNLKSATKRSTTGVLGVRRKGAHSYKAEIQTEDGQQRYIGSFATVSEAREAYLEAKRRLHAGCTI